MTFLILFSLLALVGLAGFFGGPLLVGGDTPEDKSARLAIRAIVAVVGVVLFVRPGFRQYPVRPDEARPDRTIGD